MRHEAITSYELNSELAGGTGQMVSKRVWISRLSTGGKLFRLEPRCWSIALALSSLLSLAAHASAADTPATAPDTSAATGPTSTAAAQPANEAGTEELQQIVVTAERHADPLSKVPISMSAYSQKTMDDLHIQNFQDLASVVPGLVIPPPTGGGQDSGDVAIRGIFSNGNAPTTQFYIDETPIAIRQLNSAGPQASPQPNIFDLERVEVLRGPQGTLFGSSAMGGAIRYITPQPSLTDTSGYSKADASYTDTGTPNYEVGAAYGAPIVAGTLGFRVSAWYQNAGGWINSDNPYTGNVLIANANQSDSYVVRPAITWAPTDNLTITPAIFYQHKYDVDPNSYWWRYTPSNVPSATIAPLHYDTDYSIPNPGTDDLQVSSVAVKYDFHGLSFQSDTSYLDRHSYYVDDFTRADEIIFGGTVFVPGINYYNFQAPLPDFAYTHAYQQEFRLSSDPTSRISWVAGAYYRRAVENMEQPMPGSLDVLTEAIAGETTQQLTGYPNYIINGQPYNGLTNEHAIDVETAGFADVTAELFSGLKANAGVRVEHSVVEDQSLVLAGPSDGATYSYQKLTDQVANPVTPRAGLTYQFNDEDMAYVSVAKGYRAGGGNGAAAISSSLCDPSLKALGLTGAPTSFGPDSLWSYEIGTKDTWFNRRLSIQGSIYYIDWSNIQTTVSLPSCATGFTTNRGKAVSQGFDLQVQAIVVDGLTVSATVGYTDAYYPNAAVGAPSNGVIPLLNAAGDKLPNVLPWTASVDANYSWDISRLWNGAQSYFRVDYRWFDAANSLNPNVAGYNPYTGPFQNQAYGMLNVRLGAIHEGLDLSIYLNNATNVHPILGVASDGFDGLLYARALRPLTTGVTALYRF
jgi:iron complex outermembrane receptor protein